MYKSIRWIHRQLALALALATFVYALSGWLIHYARDFFPETVITNETHVVAALSDPGASLDREAAGRTALAIRHELRIPGRLQGIQGGTSGSSGASGWRVRFSAASTQTSLAWADGDSEVRVETKHSSLGHSLAGLHHVHRGHGGPAYRMFAFGIDLIGAAMVVFAITGVILWWKLKRKKALGLGILGAGTLLTLVWIGQLAWGP